MNDIFSLFLWWLTLFGIGIIFLPLTTKLFEGFFDRGYIFSKIIGIGVLTYAVFIVGILHIVPFTSYSVYVSLLVALAVNWYFLRGGMQKFLSEKKLIIFFEELFFLLSFVILAYVRAHEPSIHGLEKFMDFGFINSILRSSYFPPKDMWFPPFPINYYYFGHLVTAYMIRLTNIPSSVGFNLMLATIFASSMTESFSLGANLVPKTALKKSRIIIGILAAFLINLAGNIHTIYTLFTPYKVDKPVPPWNLVFSWSTFPNSYWYANATRFIPFTIHEFPMYSYVVADLHGHVLDIPFVLLSLAILLSYYKKNTIRIFDLIFYSFLLAVMYMTNAWDGAVYLLAAGVILGVKNFSQLSFRGSSSKIFGKFNFIFIQNVSIYLSELLKMVLILLLGFIFFNLPFSLHFQTASIIHGIGVLCAPQFLTNIGHIGPFLFEANHCQRSSWWQFLILYGFFYFFVGVFLILLTKKKFHNLHSSTLFVICLIGISTLLIIIPEFAYVKDIYPQHYRANTMFKLVYQAFIMLALSCSYIIYYVLNVYKKYIVLPFIALFFIAVFIYPYFALSSYYQIPPTITSPCLKLSPDCIGATLKKYIMTDIANYKGLDGIKYLSTQNPADYAAIQWMNKNIHNQPIILEAQGDSYTDYDRISSYTGLPTVLGWTVHEWLWRGTYDVPAPRIAEVQTAYETKDAETAIKILQKYKVRYVYVGDLERQKYPNLSEEKFKKLGKIIFQKDNSRLYKLN